VQEGHSNQERGPERLWYSIVPPRRYC